MSLFNDLLEDEEFLTYFVCLFLKKAPYSDKIVKDMEWHEKAILFKWWFAYPDLASLKHQLLEEQETNVTEDPAFLAKMKEWHGDSALAVTAEIKKEIKKLAANG